MATPISANVGEGFESVRNTMVDFIFIVLLQLNVQSEFGFEKMSALGVLTPVDFEIHFVTTFS